MIFIFDNDLIFSRINLHMNKFIATTSLALWMAISGNALGWIEQKPLGLKRDPMNMPQSQGFWQAVCQKNAEELGKIIWDGIEERIDGIPKMFSSYRVTLTPIDWDHGTVIYPVRQRYNDKLVGILDSSAPTMIPASEKVIVNGKERILPIEEWTTTLNIDIRFTRYSMELNPETGKWEIVYECEFRN